MHECDLCTSVIYARVLENIFLQRAIVVVVVGVGPLQMAVSANRGTYEGQSCCIFRRSGIHPGVLLRHQINVELSLLALVGLCNSTVRRLGDVTQRDTVALLVRVF
jgi:hypothetical protein